MKKFLKNKVPLLIALSIALAVSLICSYLYFFSPSFLNEIDLRLSDIRFRYRGTQPTNPNVVVVAIDEKSINKLGRWVWSRNEFIKIVEKLKEYESNVVAFDIVFSEVEEDQVDKSFGESIASNKDVILGYFFRNDSTENINPDELKKHRRSRIKLIKSLPNSNEKSIFSFDSAEFNIANIAKGAKGFGFFNIFPDDDGIYRRSPLLLRFNDEIFPSLGLAGLKHFLRSQIFLTIADYGVESLNLNKLKIPVDEDGRLLLNFYGGTGAFPTYSVVDVLNGTVAKEKLKDKFVFIGATEIGIYDLRATPFDPKAPGVEVQATVVSNVLDENFLIKNSLTDLTDIVLIFVCSFLIAAIISNLNKTITSLAVLFLLGFVHIFSNYWFFKNSYLMLSVAYPMLAMGLTYVFYEGYRNLIVERRSKFLKTAFGSYVSPDLVSQIMDDPDKLKLGGDRKEISILFSDIRGFTTLSEKTTPELLVSLLNEYLTPMTDIVMNEKGTLDKFIGDAVMAIFGAPLDLDNHSEKACNAAVSMISKVEEINEDWKSRDLPTISIGIGINTGEAIVGNMGANIRFDYTAIGDSVNLASRLEGLNKYYGTSIIISDSVKDHFRDSEKFLTRELDIVRVKGKEKPISIFEIIVAGSSEIDLEDFLKKFDQALVEYRKSNFKQAKDIFEQLLKIKPDDETSRIYVDRCEHYLLEPPPDGWDYVYTAESK